MVGRRRIANIVLLDLMPFKEVTDADFMALLEHVPARVNVAWMRLRSHASKHTSASYIDSKYKFFDELSHQRFDGMIITGAPVELIPFEDVDYWPELERIMDWAHANVRSTIYICWGAQAGLYHFFGVPKYPLKKKMFGIFGQETLRSEPLLDSFPSTFPMPHSRHTEIRRQDIMQHEDLFVVAESPISGVGMVMTADGHDIFITGHMEYSTGTLDAEYHRDLGRRSDVGVPINYYKDNDPSLKPVDRWHKWALRLYWNWVKYYLSEG